jgi:hypothetical protein
VGEGFARPHSGRSRDVRPRPPVCARGRGRRHAHGRHARVSSGAGVGSASGDAGSSKEQLRSGPRPVQARSFNPALRLLPGRAGRLASQQHSSDEPWGVRGFRPFVARKEMWGRAPWPLGAFTSSGRARNGAETRAVSSGCADPRPCLVCFSSRLRLGDHAEPGFDNKQQSGLRAGSELRAARGLGVMLEERLEPATRRL